MSMLSSADSSTRKPFELISILHFGEQHRLALEHESGPAPTDFPSVGNGKAGDNWFHYKGALFLVGSSVIGNSVFEREKIAKGWEQGGCLGREMRVS
ncbi:hypothetical protein AVEN_219041-1 [Araneus ventricosus]|uniref:Uncharacterized protein n=1 Tax=Araneus ventricosus TaxID=182803 RepID=A0A4Y2H403_ARAVE|nr:hypothetical protein AVEN_219041-1 [Araneus ventricosus]